MNVTLYYVEGISRIDTPYFATKTTQASLEKQEEFFTSKIVKTIQLSYYPPHYRNAIRFDEDDLTINDNVNYLSLDCNGKKYYYFIDNINYISESLIEVEITMDVVQTYMFDIYIANGIIERKFIDRWVGTNINRSYIRENVSENEYVFSNYTVFNTDVSKWLIFVPVTNYLCSKYTTMEVKYDKSLPGLSKYNGFLMSSYCTYIIPYGTCLYTGEYYYDNGTNTGIIGGGGPVTDGDMGSREGLADYFNGNFVADLYLCPFNCCDDLELVYNSTKHANIPTFDAHYLIVYSRTVTVDQTAYRNYVFAPVDDDEQTLHTYRKAIFNSKVMKDSMEILNFDKNTIVARPYSANYITQMLDENYIHIWYGSLPNHTSIPLYYLKTSYIDCYAAFNPTDGTRIYWITPKDYPDGYDIYNTVVTDNNVLHLDMKNDPWREYAAANKGRWLAAGVNTAVSLFTKGMSTAVNNKFANEEIMSIKANPQSYDRRYKVPQLKKKPASMVATRERDIERNNMSNLTSGISSANDNIVSQAIKDMNMKLAPATPKQVGNISGVSAKDAFIMYYEELCIDYQQCAQYYHRNGYLVNEYINATPNIFAYVFNRYYFNVLKMQLPNVHLHNVIEDEDTIQAITDRLVDGLRLWNVNNQGVVIGDFQYDNVENNYLS